MKEIIVQLFEQYPVLGVVLSGLLAAHGLAVFIVNVTPTPYDDRIVGKAYKVIEWLAGVLNSAKALPGQDEFDVKASKTSFRVSQGHKQRSKHGS